MSTRARRHRNRVPGGSQAAPSAAGVWPERHSTREFLCYGEFPHHSRLQMPCAFAAVRTERNASHKPITWCKAAHHGMGRVQAIAIVPAFRQDLNPIQDQQIPAKRLERSFNPSRISGLLDIKKVQIQGRVGAACVQHFDGVDTVLGSLFEPCQ